MAGIRNRRGFRFSTCSELDTRGRARSVEMKQGTWVFIVCAQRTALRGGNPYRAKAYSRAADSLAALAVPLDVLVAEERLTEIPGVGDAIADIITKLHKTGTHPSLEELRKEVPAGVLEMLAVPGLRPEKVLRLYKDLGITSIAELEAAAKDDRIKKAKGSAPRSKPRFCRT